MSFTVYFWDGNKSAQQTCDEGSPVVVIGGLRSDWEFVGWSYQTSSINTQYYEDEVIEFEHDATDLNLYAVYQKSTTIRCYYLEGGIEDNLVSNPRTKIQYRCNTSKTASSTSFYNTITLPSFSSDNEVLTTSTPARDWYVDGWRVGTTAAAATYSGGQSVSSNRITGDLYAVYSNTCSVNYDSNGGSGSMASSSATAYYNANGSYTTPSFTISSCTFDSPTGKIFSRWNTKSNGTGTSYYGSTISTNHNIILYAIWEESWSFTVYFWDGGAYDSYECSSDNPVEVIGGLQNDDWDFVGWSFDTSSTSIVYTEGEGIEGDSSTTRLDLYAVYQKSTTIRCCYFVDGSVDRLDSNPRTKIQYRCNTSKTASSTNFYNTITLPNFSSDNEMLTTSSPDRGWFAEGWRASTTAGSATYSPGQSVSSSKITGDLYAIYSNTCSLNYNSNGGSGTMSSSSATAYYSACGTNNYTTPSISIRSCTFTPPTGKKFSHWNAESDGSGTSYTGSSVRTNHNVILYAIWIAARPDNWGWTTNVSKDVAMNCTGSGANVVVKPLTAAEWLDFLDRIKEFYEYCGKSVDSTYWYRAVNGVATDLPMTKTQANGVRWLINELNPPTAVPDAVESKDPITAAFINGLKNSLNSIN